MKKERNKEKKRKKKGRTYICRRIKIQHSCTFKFPLEKKYEVI